MANDDDTALVLLAKAGDKEAFGNLVDRHRPMALRIAGRMTANPDVARELAQEALLHAYLSLDRPRDATRFESWLYSIVLNVCRSHRRAQREDHTSLEALTGGLRFEATSLSSGSFEPDPQEVVEADELHRTVLRAVSCELALAEDEGGNAAVLLRAAHGPRDSRNPGHLGRRRQGAFAQGQEPAQGPACRHPTEFRSDQHASQKERRMIDVEVIDVLDWKAIRDDGVDVEEEKPSAMHVVVMYDSVGKRVLPIWIGPAEGQSIATGLRDVETPRPGTHAFAARMLESVGARFEEARVEQLKGTTFYGVAKLRYGTRRPGDRRSAQRRDCHGRTLEQSRTCR